MPGRVYTLWHSGFCLLRAPQKYSRGSMLPADGHYRVNEKDVIRIDTVILKTGRCWRSNSITWHNGRPCTSTKRVFQTKQNTLAYGNVHAFGSAGASFFSGGKHTSMVTTGRPLLPGTDLHPYRSDLPEAAVVSMRDRNDRSGIRACPKAAGTRAPARTGRRIGERTARTRPHRYDTADTKE
jgi:hypothetical protein